MVFHNWRVDHEISTRVGLQIWRSDLANEMPARGAQIMQLRIVHIAFVFGVSSLTIRFDLSEVGYGYIFSKRTAEQIGCRIQSLTYSN